MSHLWSSLILSLFLSASAKAETLVIPVQDLLFVVPDFDNAPDFNLNAALNGSQFIGDVNKDKNKKRDRKKIERRLTEMMWEIYPDATKITLYRGSFIINLP